jgi:SAM-dependent methyltransferase
LAPHDGESDRLYRDRTLVQFYDLDNPWGTDLEYCQELAAEASSVLDLGCGTGQFLSRLIGGVTAVGVDLAAAMLDVARARPGGDRVTWVEADARSVRLDRRFDLIVLTGHAFQVFLTPEDQQAVIDTIAAHLVPGGRFVFDSRNPDLAAWRDWTPETARWQLEHPRLGGVEAWNDVQQDASTGIVTYETHYRVIEDGRHFTTASKIAFPSQRAISDMLDSAGLLVERWLGDWQGTEFAPGSEEIIPVGRPLPQRTRAQAAPNPSRIEAPLPCAIPSRHSGSKAGEPFAEGAPPPPTYGQQT